MTFTCAEAVSVSLAYNTALFSLCPPMLPSCTSSSHISLLRAYTPPSPICNFFFFANDVVALVAFASTSLMNTMTKGQMTQKFSILLDFDQAFKEVEVRNLGSQYK